MNNFSLYSIDKTIADSTVSINGLLAPITWVIDIVAAEWDRCLAEMHGHPLQSAAWGDAKVRAGEPPDQRLMGLYQGKAVCMARVEVRKIPIIGRAAWIPKGPVYAVNVCVQKIHNLLLCELKRLGYILVLETPYTFRDVAPGWRYQSNQFQTLVIDLKQNIESIWTKFPAKLRSQISSAERKGLIISESIDPDKIAMFYQICLGVSGQKGFDLPGSLELMIQLIVNRESSIISAVNIKFLIAMVGEKMVGGYIFITIGESTHTLWSAYDRSSKFSGVSDSILWHHIKYSSNHDTSYLDQEGIDKNKNPTTYEFKRKFGGTETDLPGLHIYALSLLGKVALAVGRRMGRI
jgi:lipid II:glycine glycyltransferase (peptidoglycan interpeptide bridge formation enzyme)